MQGNVATRLSVQSMVSGKPGACGAVATRLVEAALGCVLAIVGDLSTVDSLVLVQHARNSSATTTLVPVRRRCVTVAVLFR